MPDSTDYSIDLFSISVKNFELTSNKMSNYVSEIQYHASDFSSRFGTKLGIPEKYLDFIKLPPKRSHEIDLLEIDPKQKEANIKPFSGKMKVTPDSKKEIELVYKKANLVVFSFMIRFIVELFSIDDIPQHPGFEDMSGVLNFQLKIKEAEACLLSGEESCLVVRSLLSLL